MARYEVYVGNIGRVYDGGSNLEASKTYAHYVKLSKAGSGRAAGESVVIMKNGEPEREFAGESGDRRRGRRVVPAPTGEIIGYYVMKYSGGRYGSVGFYGTKSEAAREVARIKTAGAWSGMPPKVEPAHKRPWGARKRTGARNSRGRFTRAR